MNNIKVKFYEKTDDESLKFAVIIARMNGKNVYCKHRDRETLECPGGHREAGEDILETAKRELYEETGAVDFDIKPVCVYAVVCREDSGECESCGMLYYAEIRSVEEELHSEIEKIIITDSLPGAWTYPDIQPHLMEEVKRRGFME